MLGVQARFPADRVRLEGRYSEFTRISDGGEERTFRFCPDCGATVSFMTSAAPEVVGVPVGAFADPSFPPPAVSVFESRRHSWLDVPSALEHHL